jgi:hypothetical protein
VWGQQHEGRKHIRIFIGVYVSHTTGSTSCATTRAHKH